RSTDGGQLTGTPAYMAPEYISERRSSERSDIFAAGLVLYELLAGRRALAGRDVPQVMRRRPAPVATANAPARPAAVPAAFSPASLTARGLY
ncbi:MAG TPA: protein kinase, partial [Xanthobacteraceae bacterium]|nr:protein kinase [Xanthobacteraceae bacterium]